MICTLDYCALKRIQLCNLQFFLLRQGPHFVAVNNKNEIIVTDFHNHSVKVRVALCCPLVADFGRSLLSKGVIPAVPGLQR